MRRAGVAIALLGLLGIATIAGLRSTAHPADAQSTIDLLEAGPRADFSQQLTDKNPTLTDGAVTVQSVNGTSDIPFPHMALYGGPNSSGWPMVGTLNDNRPADTAPLNESVMNAYARFPHLILPATPLADTRTDILTSLRARNPKVRIHAYVMAHTTWCPQDVNGNNSYPPNTYYRDYYLGVTGGDPGCASTSDRFLWMQDGEKADGPDHNLGINVNLAHRVQNPDNSYSYDVAEALATVMYEYGRAGRNWDGMFIDVYCPGIAWMDSAVNPSVPSTYQTGNNFDYVRAGYGTVNGQPSANNQASYEAFHAGWAAGHQRMAEKLRELAIADGHPDYPISGNCGQAPASLHPVLNGWMREGYPFQNGNPATFYTNMLTWPWGFLHQDNNFRAPQFNYIFTAANWSGGLTNNPGDEQYNSYNQRKMRFGLGSASLGNGWAAFHHSSGNPALGYWYNWWYDEYGVNSSVPTSDPNWGKAMNGAAYTGWLGAAKGNFYQMVYPNFTSNPDLFSTNQGFETAGASPSQIPGWSYTNFSPSVSTLTRDTTTAAEGSASAKMHIDVGNDPYTYAVNIHPTATIPITANQQYAVTFWAKASADRTIDVTLWNGGAIQFVYTLPITTTWQRYQAMFKPTNSFNGTVDFDFGRTTGDVWIDDAHFQAGMSSVYRRDFEHGIVLVNPADTPQTVTLEKPFRKILGTVNPTLNDGSQVSSVTLAGTNSGAGVGDAIFLLDLDVVAPSATTDLRAP